MIYLLTNKDNVIVAISSTITKVGEVYTTAENKKFLATNLTLVSLNSIPENVSTLSYGYTETSGVYRIEKDFEESYPLGTLTEKGLTKRPLVHQRENIIDFNNTWKETYGVDMAKLTQLVTTGDDKLPTVDNIKTFRQGKIFRNISVTTQNWVGESAPYKKTITVKGIKADKMLIKQPSDDMTDAKAIFVEKNIYHIASENDDEIILYSAEALTTNVMIDIIQI